MVVTYIVYLYATCIKLTEARLESRNNRNDDLLQSSN